MPDFIKIHNKETGGETLVEKLAYEAIWKSRGWRKGRLPEKKEAPPEKAKPE